MPDYELQTPMNHEITDGELRYYIMRIAYPTDNIDDNIPLLLATVTDELVLVPVVDAAQHGTIAELAAHGRDLAVELGAVHLAQARATELGGDGLHLTGDGGVIGSSPRPSRRSD